MRAIGPHLDHDVKSRQDSSVTPSDGRTPDRLNDGAEAGSSQSDAGDKGAELADVRARITQRLMGMADKALNTYDSVMTAPHRYSPAQLSAARDVLELLTEGKLQAPVQVRPQQAAKPAELKQLSEHVRLLKQAERRGA
jgi:hypothetical protein